MSHDGYALCAWCGDSRIHLIREREVFLLTRDHSLVQEMIDRGELDQDSARTHRASHVVNRAVGNLIRDCKTVQIRSLMQTGAAHGMYLLDSSLSELVKAGKITREAALEVCEDPKLIPA